ncbi:alpha/beta hydrolase [Ornithinimicrobium sp. Y1847]|uniref:alpha/beta hydrolase n=1 Tax=Ornithinimicrobium sp. Y1847 TaxID=3405419 RepID=UPI003B681312
MKSRTTLSRGLLAAVGAAAIALPTAVAATAAPGNGNGNGNNSASNNSASNNGAQGNNGNGQKGGPDAGVLAAHLLDQELEWEACTFGNPRVDAIPGLACADVTVPRDWHNPTDGNTITVRISKTQTAGEDRQGMALVNPGGPGGSGLIWGPGMAMLSPELAEHYDFYGFDPRGVGRSTPLTCTYIPTPDASYDEDQRDRVNGCLENELTQFITTEQTAYDMDFIRALHGEDKLSYVGFSYGTWLGKWYQSVFPEHSHRFLLDSAVDVTRKSLQETWDLQPRSRDRQFQEMMLPYAARNADVFDMPSDDPMELRRYWELGGGNREFLGQLITSWFILPAMYNTNDYPEAVDMAGMIINQGVAREAAGQAADEDLSLQETREALINIVNEVADAGRLDATQIDRLRAMEANALEEIDHLIETEAAAEAGTPVSYNYVFEAIRCQDGPWNSSDGFWNAWLGDLDRKAPWIAPFMSAPACKHWPAVTEMPKATGNSYPGAIVIQSEMDAATPWEGGERSAHQLARTSLIAVDNEGSHGLYPYGTSCVDDAVNAYFIDGTMPPERTVCGALPLPLETETFEVGADLGAPGNNNLKMRTDKVKEANDLLKGLLADSQPSN